MPRLPQTGSLPWRWGEELENTKHWVYELILRSWLCAMTSCCFTCIFHCVRVLLFIMICEGSYCISTWAPDSLFYSTIFCLSSVVSAGLQRDLWPQQATVQIQAKILTTHVSDKYQLAAISAHLQTVRTGRRVALMRSYATKWAGSWTAENAGPTNPPCKQALCFWACLV